MMDFFFNLTIYEFMMIQQTISQQCVLCWAKRELFVYPAMFPHLPEHLASRYVIFYACVTMRRAFTLTLSLDSKSQFSGRKEAFSLFVRARALFGEQTMMWKQNPHTPMYFHSFSEGEKHHYYTSLDFDIIKRM